MTAVEEIIESLREYGYGRNPEFITEIIRNSLAHQINEEKVKQTALNCYAEDVYEELRHQPYEKTLDEYCDTFGFQELVKVLMERHI